MLLLNVLARENAELVLRYLERVPGARPRAGSYALSGAAGDLESSP